MPTKKEKSKTGSDTSRPPIVVVMGHVDHGKTTLLDSIRKTDVATREYGGITQSIGAYQVSVPNSDQKITFIDTPGHEAFSAMRSRGAMAADIAILVVAANDSVMPQTIESIKTIEQAKIPFIVAITKIDLPEANSDKVISDLLRQNVLLENYGGDVPYIKVSAKTEKGIKELLDLIQLLAEVKEIGRNLSTELEAVVIESKMDKNRGPLATVIVRSGTLSVGEEVFIGKQKGKIRALSDYKGEQMKQANPGTPAEILGLSEVPPVGTRISKTVRFDESDIKDGRQKSESESEQQLKLILKADTVGSLEAIAAKVAENVALLDLKVGEINEADVMLAKNTGAIILGFNVKVSTPAAQLAESERVLVRTYKIIYELLEELEDAAAGMLESLVVEETLGSGQIIAEFPFEKLRVCGTRVTSGRLARGDLARITRGEETVGEAKIKSIRMAREETTKVEKGKECGIFLEPQIDFRVGDAIIAYRK